MSGSPAVVVLGARGLDVARRVREGLAKAELHGPRTLPPDTVLDVAYADLKAHLRALFQERRPIVAISAAGIPIRILAPLLGDKAAEPPVLAVAEDGSFVVPLLGGHRGANRMARAIAAALGAHAAITTAGDLRFGLALDEPPAGWTVRNPGAVKAVTAALLEGRPVRLEVETGDAAWLTDGGAPFGDAGAHGVLTTHRDVAGGPQQLVLHPKVLTLGVGCERDTDPAELIALVADALARHGMATAAIACVASIDLKAAEPAVHALAEHLGVPVRFFGAGELEAEAARLATPSAEVFAATGAHGVAEGAALAAAGPDGVLEVAKTRSRRATCAIARAAAPVDPEHIGRAQGRLMLIGIGPGDAAWRTREADALLRRAEDVVGYGGYLDLLGEMAGQCRHAFALGEEEARCRHALDLAAAGRRVALVGSGDVGIYAMAALVFELLDRDADPAWQGVAITVAPGVSALQAAAARAGAPLGHDFCAISLSDLLTPWAVIEQRLEAAAEGDFVVALYNPASAARREGLRRALAILGRRRPPATPVIHGRNLGRPGETVTTTPLGDFDPKAVDMLSLVIVGSSATRAVTPARGRPFVYTPRGYAAVKEPAQ